jgi:hypothetical protein
MESENCSIRRCSCKHEYQDKRYGKGRRVHNKVENESAHGGKWRCTVCTNVKS